MIETKTTNQIVNNSHGDCYNKVWVGLESLKKEIHNIVKEIAELSTQYDKNNELWWGMDTSLGKNLPADIEELIENKLGLCNSQEQEKELKDYEKSLVSCEHNIKKCTCPRPEPRLPEELFNNKCGRCGGEL